MGIPTLDGMGGVGEGAHAINESILVDRIADRTALLAKLIAGIPELTDRGVSPRTEKRGQPADFRTAPAMTTTQFGGRNSMAVPRFRPQRTSATGH